MEHPRKETKSVAEQIPMRTLRPVDDAKVPLSYCIKHDIHFAYRCYFCKGEEDGV